MFFRNLRIKFSEIIWLDYELYGNSQYKINDATNFRVPRPKRPHPFLTTTITTKKLLKVTFSFPEFVPTHQKSIYSIHFSLTYSQF